MPSTTPEPSNVFTANPEMVINALGVLVKRLGGSVTITQKEMDSVASIKAECLGCFEAFSLSVKP